MSVTIKEHFTSLNACVAYLNRTYVGETRVVAKDRLTGDSKGAVSVPAFLFRGESMQYPSTTATIGRISSDPTLSPRGRQLLPKLSAHIEQELRDFLRMGLMDSAGFAQHYGLPTELVDLTSDCRVAGFFASGGEVGTCGYMAAFPMKRLSESAILIDLRNHDSADRPRRQHAFAIFHRKYLDLKAPECIEELTSDWFSFTLTDEDKATLHEQLSLLDAHTDPVAGTLQLVIDSMVQKNGKLPDDIAKWLSERIAPAPFVAKVRSWRSPEQPDEVELVSMAEADIPYDEATGKDRNYQRWSANSGVRSRGDA